MIDPPVLGALEVTALRLVAWAVVGVAAALLLQAVVWLLCCGIDGRGRLAARPPRANPPDPFGPPRHPVA
jgi:hypothetical protein